MRKKKTILMLAILLSIGTVLAQPQTQPVQPQPQTQPQTLSSVIPAEDLEILKERKKKELNELRIYNERMKTLSDMERQGIVIQKKKLKKGILFEDIKQRELEEYPLSVKLTIPVKGIIGDIAITDEMPIVKGQKIYSYKVEKIEPTGIVIGKTGINIYGAKTDTTISELQKVDIPDLSQLPIPSMPTAGQQIPSTPSGQPFQPLPPTPMR